jgi:hypothetical protein
MDSANIHSILDFLQNPSISIDNGDIVFFPRQDLCDRRSDLAASEYDYFHFPVPAPLNFPASLPGLPDAAKIKPIAMIHPGQSLPAVTGLQSRNLVYGL